MQPSQVQSRTPPGWRRRIKRSFWLVTGTREEEPFGSEVSEVGWPDHQQEAVAAARGDSLWRWVEVLGVGSGRVGSGRGRGMERVQPAVSSAS